MTMLDGEVRWHDDGHRLALELNRSELVVTTVVCPKDGVPDAPCQHPRWGCVVDYFVSRFGLECHVGVCVPSDEIRVAWALVGDQVDLDAAQVWVISTSDDIFAAWADTMRS